MVQSAGCRRWLLDDRLAWSGVAGGWRTPRARRPARPAGRPAAQDALGRDGPAGHGRDQPAAGDGDGDPRLAARRQRRRCGDRGQRRARAWSSRCRAASAATCSPSSGMPRPRSSIGLNASGRAPAAATIELFKAKGLATIPDHGPLSWSVPGCVDGWDQLRKRFGTKPWSELLAPAIAYAETGFPVSEIIAADWQERRAEPASRSPPRPPASCPADTRPQAGSIFRNPGLARSLRAIAQDGRDAFYQGPLADAIVRYSQSVGGLFSPAGLRRAHQHVRRSGLDQLSRLRRLGAAAQRPGDRRAPDAQPARAVRPQERGAAVGRGAASDDRGQEAGLRRSGQVLRRPRLRPGAGRDPDLQAVRRAPARRDRSPSRPICTRRRASPCRPTRST